MSLEIAFQLVGSGWAKCVIADERAKCEITASYLSNALNHLVLAALGVLSGFKSVSFSFDEEPGEYRWVIESIEMNVIKIDVLEFSELWANKPNTEGKLLLSTSCRPLIFARAVWYAAKAVFVEYGDAGYLKAWSEHPFPIRELALLTELLEMPHNAN